jgi:hypothetical protein
MQSYIKGSVGPFMTVQYNGLLEAYMQGYNMGSMGLFMTVHYYG